MEYIKKNIRRRSILRLEKNIAREFSIGITEFLSLPAIVQLRQHYDRQRIIESELLKIKHDMKRLEKSKLWGNNICAVFFCWPEDVYQEELDKRAKSIKEIQSVIGMTITSEHLEKLKLQSAEFESKKYILRRADRELLASRKNETGFADRRMIQASALIAGFGVTAHTWDSIAQSNMIYDALRRVNSKFENLSDSEVWFETMILSVLDRDSYQGMVNLAKGAYFEQLVANDTGGVLHDNFNTANTDITIDCETIQLKATDSASLIENIDPTISIIATSEIAARTSASDSGISNEEITRNTENALGGDPFDTSGSLADGVAFFSGGFGVLAVLRGLGAAGEYLESSKINRTQGGTRDREEEWLELASASAVGIETAIESTIRAIPALWNILVTLAKWGLNIIHIILYPFIKLLGL